VELVVKLKRSIAKKGDITDEKEATKEKLIAGYTPKHIPACPWMQPN
jgi:hypothetical protein